MPLKYLMYDMTLFLYLNVLLLCRCVYCSCQAHTIWYLWWCVEGPQCNRLGWACGQSCSLSRGHRTRTCKQCHHGKCHAGTQNVCLTDHSRSHVKVVWMWFCPWFVSKLFIFDLSLQMSELCWRPLHCSSYGSEVWHSHPSACSHSEQTVWIWFPVHHQWCSGEHLTKEKIIICQKYKC